MKKQYSTIDIARFFFALCIVALHSYALEDIPKLLFFGIHKGVFRLAVPYFFVASGFFYWQSCSSNGRLGDRGIFEHMFKYCKRVLLPFMVFSLINTCQKIVSIVFSGQFSGSAFVNILKHIFFMPYGPVWFLSACAVGIVMLSFFLWYNMLNVAIGLGMVLYAFALLCNNYYFIIQGTIVQDLVDSYLAIFISPRNGVFTGFFFLALGAKCSTLKGRWTNKRVTIVLALTYILYSIECIIVQMIGTPMDDGSLYIMHILVIPSLFILTSQIEICSNEKFAKKLRNYSMGIYLLHVPILWFLWLFCENGILNFILTIMICFVICTFSYRSKNKVFNQLLR